MLSGLVEGLCMKWAKTSWDRQYFMLNNEDTKDYLLMVLRRWYRCRRWLHYLRRRKHEWRRHDTTARCRVGRRRIQHTGGTRQRRRWHHERREHRWIWHRGEKRQIGHWREQRRSRHARRWEAIGRRYVEGLEKEDGLVMYSNWFFKILHKTKFKAISSLFFEPLLFHTTNVAYQVLATLERCKTIQWGVFLYNRTLLKIRKYDVFRKKKSFIKYKTAPDPNVCSQNSRIRNIQYFFNPFYCQSKKYCLFL